MNPTQDVEKDLEYVRSVLHEAERGDSPASIYFLWAALVFVGFTLIDFRPQHSGLFWFVAGPLGGAISFMIGRRAALAQGQYSAREGRLHALHWTGFMAAILLVLALHAAGRLPMGAVPQVIVLLAAFSYYTSGLYLDRRMLPVGLLMAACYLVTLFVPLRFPWTLTAVVIAGGLLASGFLARAAAIRAPRGERP